MAASSWAYAMSSYRSTVFNSTPSRSSLRAAIGCLPTGSATAAQRLRSRWCVSLRTRWPTPSRRLRRERQRDRVAELDCRARRRALSHHRVGPLAAVLHIGSPDQLAGPAIGVAQIRLDVGPEPAAHVGHHELVAPRQLQLDRSIDRRIL